MQSDCCTAKRRPPAITVFADQVEPLSPVEEMKLIERMAVVPSIHALPPVGLHKAGEVKEFGIEDWKKRTAYKA